jgi:hypothetical protein
MTILAMLLCMLRQALPKRSSLILGFTMPPFLTSQRRRISDGWLAASYITPIHKLL